MEDRVEAESVQEAIRCVVQGNKSAYEIVVKAYMRKAYYTALGFVGSHEDAEDLSQQAFVKAYRAISQWDTERPFFPWFRKILKNVCLDHHRKTRKMLEVPIERVHARGDTGDLVREESLHRTVWKAVSELEDKHREVIRLKYFQRLSYKEISIELSCSIGTVMSRLYYAKKQLKQKLSGVFS
jgi:RNA polymerase sigma-70 factor (ECF subfamily)